MTKARLYYTLLVRRDGRWGIEFGDYLHGTVLDERDSLIDGHEEVRKRDTKIIQTDDTQAAIDAVVAKLNEGAANG